MPRLLLILAIAVSLWYWWTVVKRLEPEQRRLFLWRSAFWSVLGISVILVATGRMHWLGAGLAALIPISKGLFAFGLRALPVLRLLSRFKTSPSQFRTQALLMEINFSNSRVDGEVLQGEFAGSRLSELTAEQLQTLSGWLKETDRESFVLLQAFLLRNSRDGAQSTGGNTATYADFSEDEAYRILGLEVGASKDDIVKAHRRLMQRLHPDRGGSDYLAAKINAAKDKLL
jgi:DnaJ-domain-containing protein 1